MLLLLGAYALVPSNHRVKVNHKNKETVIQNIRFFDCLFIGPKDFCVTLNMFSSQHAVFTQSLFPPGILVILQKR